MGMFDTFEADAECPECEGLTGSDWQTKELASLMDRWKTGDLFEVNGGLVVNTGAIFCYNSCQHCGTWLEGMAYIEDGIFIGIQDVEKPRECYHCDGNIGKMGYGILVYTSHLGEKIWWHVNCLAELSSVANRVKEIANIEKLSKMFDSMVVKDHDEEEEEEDCDLCDRKEGNCFHPLLDAKAEEELLG